MLYHIFEARGLPPFRLGKVVCVNVDPGGLFRRVLHLQLVSRNATYTIEGGLLRHVRLERAVCVLNGIVFLLHLVDLNHETVHCDNIVDVENDRYSKGKEEKDDVEC